MAAEGSHEFQIDLRVACEPGGDIGLCRYLDFVEEMPKRRRSKPMQMLDEPLAPKLLNRRKLCLRCGVILG
jgi:hypothetical protein